MHEREQTAILQMRSHFANWHTDDCEGLWEAVTWCPSFCHPQRERERRELCPVLEQMSHQWLTNTFTHNGFIPRCKADDNL